MNATCTGEHQVSSKHGKRTWTARGVLTCCNARCFLAKRLASEVMDKENELPVNAYIYYSVMIFALFIYPFCVCAGVQHFPKSNWNMLWFLPVYYAFIRVGGNMLWRLRHNARWPRYLIERFELAAYYIHFFLLPIIAVCWVAPRLRGKNMGG